MELGSCRLANCGMGMSADHVEGCSYPHGCAIAGLDRQSASMQAPWRRLPCSRGDQRSIRFIAGLHSCAIIIRGIAQFATCQDMMPF
jgi:hypothetical protein